MPEAVNSNPNIVDRSAVARYRAEGAAVLAKEPGGNLGSNRNVLEATS